MAPRILRIGTRGSELALWQARWVEAELTEAYPDLTISIDVIKTTGDRILESPLWGIGDPGIFTREIEQSLLRRDIDIAVHSLKDLPTELPAALTIGAVTAREDVRDVFIPHLNNGRRRLMEQAEGASIATGSLRRRCQLMAMGRRFEVAEVRGNLNTRMRKLAESEWAGMILAHAGILRLGWEDRIGEVLPVSVLLPAVGQGALAVEIRSGDERVASLVQSLDDEPTRRATWAERALLRRLQGGCQIPVGAYGRIEYDARGHAVLVLDALVGSLDGQRIVRGSLSGDPVDAEGVGVRLAESLLRDGAEEILREIRQMRTPEQ